MIESKYDNRTREFFKSIEPLLTLQEKAKILDVTYESLHYSFKINKISRKLFYKVLEKIELDIKQKQQLKSLLKGQ